MHCRLINHAKIIQSKMQNIEDSMFAVSEALNILPVTTSNYQFQKYVQIYTEKGERKRSGEITEQA